MGSQSSVSRESVPIDTRDTENAWHAEQQLPADIGEREQVNLPRADGGKEAWLFLCGCFTIEALVWGRLNTYFVFDYTSMSHSSASLRALFEGFCLSRMLAPHFLIFTLSSNTAGYGEIVSRLMDHSLNFYPT